MLEMSDKPIINDPESSCQEEFQTSHLQDGLRVLARIIARNLLAGRSVYTEKDNLKVNDKNVSEGN